MSKILNGRYEVYYDKSKTKLMAKIGFSDDIVDGKLERYGINGRKVYETAISKSKINGLLKVFKDENMFIQIVFNNDVVNLVIIDNNYSYTVDFNDKEIPHGSLRIMNGNINVLNGEIVNGVFSSMAVYKKDGTLDSNLQFNNGKYHLTNRYRTNGNELMMFEYENGVRGPIGNYVSDMYFGLDIDLTYGHDILQRAGKAYSKL